MNRVRLRWKKPTLTKDDVFGLYRDMDIAGVSEDRTLLLTRGQWATLFQSVSGLIWSHPLKLFGIKLEVEPWRRWRP